MKKTTQYLVAGFLSLALPSLTIAQTVLVQDGRPATRIVATANPVDREAAVLLQDFVQRMTTTQLPIVEGGKSRPGDIVIGQGNREGLTEDGFRLETSDGRLYISSGGDKGSIYGVVTLLEKYMGVSCYAAHTYTYPKSSSLSIPAINWHENPAFRYRQTQAYSAYQDPVYKHWFRLEEPNEEFACNYWVHTFQQLVPAAEFGKSHPEYYSMIDGVRRPGSASQLCLSNPDVFRIIAHRVDSIFKAYPDYHVISVSQNDGSKTYCTCPACKAIDEKEGEPSGSIIHFVNKLAKRFPDKEISTLAYQYSMQPPRHVKPLPNVNILLCNIDCRREVPLTDNASGREFVKAIEGWSAISDNLFVWDYGINFDNYLVAFPNFHVMKKNLQLFKRNHATKVFSQIGGALGSDLTEMRAYMESKLMWNPEVDADSLMRSFMDGYYGAAAPFLYQYEKLLEGALLGSGADLWIYDTALSHKKGMLNPHCRKIYNELFDRAEEAVRDNKELYDHVRRSRISLLYADLEMARTESNHSTEELKALVDKFEEYVTAYDVKVLNERGNRTLDYCKLYKERYFPGSHSNLAKGAKVTWITKPAEAYREVAAAALTDEYLAGDSSKEPGWIGWQGEDGIFVLDMKEVKEVSSISSDFLYQVGQWSLFPKRVTYAYSEDGKHYTTFGQDSIEQVRSYPTLYREVKCIKDQPVKARFVKVHIENLGVCPGWHFGAGHPSWFFVDEVTVQ